MPELLIFGKIKNPHTDITSGISLLKLVTFGHTKNLKQIDSWVWPGLMGEGILGLRIILRLDISKKNYIFIVAP